MSTHHRLARRAQLRSQALQEPHLLAHAHLLAISSRDPITVSAGVWQRRLEGHIFRQIGYFHIADRHQGGMRITRICPGKASLEISFSNMPRYQISRLANSLPSWYAGEQALANGYPGLRYRPLPQAQGIEFYVLARPCSVIVRGVSVTAFEEACHPNLDDELEGARTEQYLHGAEALSTGPEGDETDLAVSAIIRRAGILLAGNADSIDLWSTRPDRLSIEIVTQDRSQATYNKIISGLTSAEFSPRLFMTETEGHGGYRTTFRLEDHTTKIDLRIQTL